jgi:hypothetical protein
MPLVEMERKASYVLGPGFLHKSWLASAHCNRQDTAKFRPQKIIKGQVKMSCAWSKCYMSSQRSKQTVRMWRMDKWHPQWQTVLYFKNT